MEKGVDTSKLGKLLDEGRSKLSLSHTSTLNEYDVEGCFSVCIMVMSSHINKYHEDAIISTLDESQTVFESTASQRIWEMMDKEFESAKSSILESERTKTSINLSPPLSSISHFHSLSNHPDNLPLNTRKLVTPPILSSTSSLPFLYFL